MNNSSVIFHIKEFFTLRCVEYAERTAPLASDKLIHRFNSPMNWQNFANALNVLSLLKTDTSSYVIQKQVVIVQFVPLFCASERGIQTIYLKPNKLPKNMPPWPKLAKMKTTSLATLKDNPQSVGQNSMLTKFNFSLGLFDHAFYFYPAFWINMHLRPQQAIH